MTLRRALVAIFGLIQSIIAISTAIFACIIHFNLFEMQKSLILPEESIRFSVMVLLGVSFFSLVSGLFLIYELLKSY